MDDHGEPPPEQKSIPTTIHSLGEDLLREIFLRLPSLATLVRAACTCPAWLRAVSSSPEFRCRFRALHPAPLLGLFVQPGNPAIPAFSPSCRLDRDQLAAVRGGDFLFTSAQPRNDASVWTIEDCRGGHLLLADRLAGTLALFNPMARASCPSLTLFSTPPADLKANHRGYCILFGVHLLYSDEDPTRFRVVAFCHDESRVAASIFSSDTLAWQTVPWLNITAQPHEYNTLWLHPGMQANGSLYWTSRDQRYTLILNTSVMKFSIVFLSPELRTKADRLFVCGIKDGALCIAYTVGFTVVVIIKKVDEHGIVTELHKTVQLEQEVRQIDAGNLQHNHPGLTILEIRDGFLYLATSELFYDAPLYCWFMSLCLDTMKLKMLLRRRYDGDMFPYIMRWPRALVEDYGILASEGADAPLSA